MNFAAPSSALGAVRRALPRQLLLLLFELSDISSQSAFTALDQCFRRASAFAYRAASTDVCSADL